LLSSRPAAKVHVTAPSVMCQQCVAVGMNRDPAGGNVFVD
jgi:hypothetical protein